MTRVYQSPDKTSGLRVLAVGAGAYPDARVATATLPALKSLTSVVPSITTFLRKLLVDWRGDLSLDLLSVDLLLTDPLTPAGAEWPGFGVPGEIAPGTSLEPPTRQNLEDALTAALKGATAADGLMLLFCGHGFSRGDRYFVLSDFGRGENPWNRCVNLDDLAMGLRQKAPRTQWLFWDCCADIPEQILDAIGTVGDAIIGTSASQVAAATTTFGPLSRFGIASSPAGLQAFGVPDGVSRFTEMLIEAIDVAGAVRRQGGEWWVDDRGIVDALQSFARRHPELEDPAFYSFVTPFSSDAPQRIRLRKLASAPTSLLIAAATPRRTALKTAAVSISGAGGAAIDVPPPPRRESMLHLRIPALQHYTVTVEFAGASGSLARQTVDCFADLPLAETAEFESP